MKKASIFLLLLALALGYFVFHQTYSKVYLTYVSNDGQSSESIIRGLAAYQEFADKAILVTNRPGQATAMGKLITTPNGMAMLLTDIPKSAHTFRDNYSRESSTRSTFAILTIIIAAFGFQVLFMKNPSLGPLSSADTVQE